MLDPKSLECLHKVVSLQGFEVAARAMGMTQSAVSQRIKQLELLLDQHLVARKPPFELSVAGRKLLGLYQQWRQLEADTLNSLQVAEDEWQTLHLAINMDSLSLWFMDAIEPLMKARKLLIDLKVDDQDTTQTLLQNGEVSACISSSEQVPKGCNSQLLGYMKYVPLASTAFIARYGLQDLQQLAVAPMVMFSYKDDLQHQWLARQLGRIVNPPSHVVPANEQFMQLIVHGYAWGMVPEVEALKAMQEYAVVPLAIQAAYVPLYWQSWNLKTDLMLDLSRQLHRAAKKVLVHELTN